MLRSFLVDLSNSTFVSPLSGSIAVSIGISTTNKHTLGVGAPITGLSVDLVLCLLFVVGVISAMRPG